MSTQPPTENIQKNDETQKENLTIETNDVELTIEDKKNVMVLNLFIDLLANDEHLNKLKLDLFNVSFEI